MAYVEVIFPDRPSERFPLSEREGIIGRAQAADITIPVGYVSSRHTAIQLCALVKDLNSLNGTWVGEEQIAEHVLRDGEEFHFGEANGPKLRVHLAEGDLAGDTRPGATIQFSPGASAPPPSPPKDDAAKRELERRVAELERERDALRQELAARGNEAASSEIFSRPVQEPPDRSGDDRAGEELAAARRELEEMRTRIASAEKERERLSAELTAAREGASSTAGSSEDGRAEAERLLAEARQQVVDLTAERDRLKSDLDRRAAQPVAVAAADPDAAHALLVSFAAQREDDELSNPAILQTMKQREGFLSDAGFLLGKLFVFSRRVEKVVSETALAFRGGRAAAGNATMLPAWQQSINRTVQGLLMQGGQDLEREFEEHLSKLGQWFMACFWAYKRGSSAWWQQTYEAISPRTIQGRIKPHAWSKMVGGDYRKYWETYCELMADLTPDIVEDEIDENAAEVARKMIDGEE